MGTSGPLFNHSLPGWAGGRNLGFHSNKGLWKLPALARDLRPTRGAKVDQPN